MKNTIHPALRVMLSLAAAALLPCLAMAAEHTGPALFQGFHHGDAFSEVATVEGAYDCSELMGTPTLCLDGRDYLGQPWDTLLEFEDDRLIQVSMFTPFSQDIYTKTFKALATDYRLVAMQSSEPPLDLVALEAEIGAHAPYSGQVVDYEQRGMKASSLAYVMLERSALSEARAASAMELRALADPDVREVGVVLSKDDQGRDWLSVSFSRPRL